MTEERILEALDCLKMTYHKNNDCYRLINYLRSNVDDIIEAMGGDEPIEAPLPKYTLWMTIDTDDDAELKYKGNSYCWYSDDLRINKSFDTLTQLIDYLTKEVEVVEGGKATDWVREFINTSCQEVIEHNFEDGSFNHDTCGNQEMTFNVSINK
jgi:hypothetical protein